MSTKKEESLTVNVDELRFPWMHVNKNNSQIFHSLCFISFGVIESQTSFSCLKSLDTSENEEDVYQQIVLVFFWLDFTIRIQREFSTDLNYKSELTETNNLQMTLLSCCWHTLFQKQLSNEDTVYLISFEAEPRSSPDSIKIAFFLFCLMRRYRHFRRLPWVMWKSLTASRGSRVVVFWVSVSSPCK